MNIWTTKSIQLANQRNYLDLLYKVYPMSVNLRRELNNTSKAKIRNLLTNRRAKELITELLSHEIFPIKDSYVAYLKRDKSAINRNPNTIARLSSILYQMDIEDIFDKMTLPKETNRQIGPLFKSWIESNPFNCKITSNKDIFLQSQENIVFNASDDLMKNLACTHLGYQRNKGLDFIAKFNNKYIIAEAKFLTDFGGHQNAQFEDAINTMKTSLIPTDKDVKAISILDGVVYIKGKGKMYKTLLSFDNNDIAISSVLLSDYLYSL